MKPQCVLYSTVLPHSSPKKAKLCLYLKSNHKNFIYKPLEVFKEKEHLLKQSQIDCPTAWKGTVYSHNHAVHAYIAIAQEKLLV